MFNKSAEINEENISEKTTEIQHKLNANKVGNASLTIATVVLIVVSLKFNMQFAPFIILLMSSRIGSSIYMIIKTFSKQEFRKLILWCALFMKSMFTCFEFFAFSI